MLRYSIITGLVSGFIKSAFLTKINSYVDYRDELVIGTHHAIKGMDWCLLAKIDAEEAFAPVHKLVRLMILLFMILLAVSGIVAFFTAKNITRPIIKLRRKTYEIEKGNWDYQVIIDTQDEIGQFSKAFDNMTVRLKNARDELQSHQDQLEIKVADRTTELSKRLEEIEQHEITLYNSEAKYKELFNNMSSGVVVYLAKDNGEDFVFKDINRAVEKIEKVKKADL